MLDIQPAPATIVRDEVRLNDPYDVQHWAKIFGVTNLDIAIAVRNAGPKAADVAYILGKPWRRSDASNLRA
jgi:hypothetical protein